MILRADGFSKGAGYLAGSYFRAVAVANFRLVDPISVENRVLVASRLTPRLDWARDSYQVHKGTPI